MLRPPELSSVGTANLGIVTFTLTTFPAEKASVLLAEALGKEFNFLCHIRLKNYWYLLPFVYIRHGFKFTPVLGEIIADAVEKKPNKAGENFKWRLPKGGKVSEACRFGDGEPTIIQHEQSKL